MTQRRGAQRRQGNANRTLIGIIRKWANLRRHRAFKDGAEGPCISPGTYLSSPRPTGAPGISPQAASPRTTKAVPEFEGITAWVNSKPLTMKGLKDKVVVVYFMAFG